MERERDKKERGESPKAEKLKRGESRGHKRRMVNIREGKQRTEEKERYTGGWESPWERARVG